MLKRWTSGITILEVKTAQGAQGRYCVDYDKIMANASRRGPPADCLRNQIACTPWTWGPAIRRPLIRRLFHYTSYYAVFVSPSVREHGLSSLPLLANGKDYSACRVN